MVLHRPNAVYTSKVTLECSCGWTTDEDMDWDAHLEAPQPWQSHRLAPLQVAVPKADPGTMTFTYAPPVTAPINSTANRGDSNG